MIVMARKMVQTQSFLTTSRGLDPIQIQTPSPEMGPTGTIVAALSPPSRLYFLPYISLFICVSACRFLAGSSESDSDDDKRVVKSAKHKRFEELTSTCNEIRV